MKNLLKIFDEKFSEEKKLLIKEYDISLFNSYENNENNENKEDKIISNLKNSLISFLNDYHPRFFYNDIVKNINELGFIDEISAISYYKEFFEFYEINKKLVEIFENMITKGIIILDQNEKKLISNYFDVLRLKEFKKLFI